MQAQTRAKAPRACYLLACGGHWGYMVFFTIVILWYVLTNNYRKCSSALRAGADTRFDFKHTRNGGRHSLHRHTAVGAGIGYIHRNWVIPCIF